MGSDPVPFFAHAVWFFYKSKWLKNIKNVNYTIVKQLAISSDLLMIH